jgi:hypothetical protein
MEMSARPMKQMNGTVLRRRSPVADTRSKAAAAGAPAHAVGDLEQNTVITGGTRVHGRGAVRATGLASDVFTVSGVERCGTEHGQLEVVFYKEILDHFGFPHRCELMRLSIPPTGRDLAISSAIQRFEREKRVNNWRTAADGYEVVSVLASIR